MAFDGRITGFLSRSGTRSPAVSRDGGVRTETSATVPPAPQRTSFDQAPPAVRGADRPRLGRGGFAYQSGRPLSLPALRGAGERAADVSVKAVQATRRTVTPLVLWIEGLRRTGSVFAIVALAVVSGLIVCAALGLLLWAASVVFAPQLQMLSHILFFTPLD